MSELTKGGSGFVGYEYKEVSARRDRVSILLDGYRSFGWVFDENNAPQKSGSLVLLKLKRDRKILNKAELTRLQRHFESCMEEIAMLEKAKTSAAKAAAITVGLVGTAFMALSTFAVTHAPPLLLPCVLFAIPGLVGWGLPYYIYKEILKRRSAKILPLTEKKYDEIYEVCEKGNNLLI